MVDLIGFRLSTATVLFHAAVAERLGISATDLKCWSIVQRDGPMTAGELAARVQLTTGAITGVLDRLERGGFVRRAADPADRRRVVIEQLEDPGRDAAVWQLYGPMGHAITALVNTYDADEQALILAFLEQATAVIERETARLRDS
jgi:DNA-binding MarR family transcriptional regulator